ncbi:MAG: SH3 domain-containing protein [Dorea sp.]|jgi:uncharacterized protein YgiM (DUF1202 family)|nr:SH3 domain-containing protein [Dorea sp.]
MEQGRNTGEDRYTGPGGYSGQGGYPEQGGFGQQNGRMDWGTPSYSNPPVGEGLNKKPEKNKFMLPIIIGGFILVIIIIVVLLLLGWKFVLNGDKEVETIGDYYVTGCKEIMKVREEEDKESKVVTKLDNGEKVSLIEKSEGNYWKVYIEAEEVTGYVDYHYLTNKSDAVMEPVTRYVNIKKEESLSILSTPDSDGASLGVVKRGDEVIVLAKPDDTYSYIYAADESAYGYVEKSKLSEDEIKDEPAKEDSKEDKKEDDKANTAQPSADVLGAGSPPANYQGIYYVKVAKGYLALRNAKAFDTSNEIGKMYNGDYVQAIRTNETYWYVYSPSLGAYGYTNSEYLVSSTSSAASSYRDVYYANVASGYLALRDAQAYDSSNEIGKIANGQEVIVIDSSSGTYWYVYVPALNDYGYVNSEYLRR